MDTLIFSQTAVFRLQQLATAFYHKTGVRHRMASQEGILSLLRETALSTDLDVRQHYDAFVMELNKRQLDMLEARGAKARAPMSVSVGSSVVRPIRKAV
jgi:hypothetical protein